MATNVTRSPPCHAGVGASVDMSIAECDPPRLILHRYRDRFMVEVYVSTRFGPLVFVFFARPSGRGVHIRDLFVDCYKGRRWLGRAEVIDEKTRNEVRWQHLLFLPLVRRALAWATRRRLSPRCWCPVGHPEKCWGTNHGPQPKLPALPELRRGIKARCRVPHRGCCVAASSGQRHAGGDYFAVGDGGLASCVFRDLSGLSGARPPAAARR